MLNAIDTITLAMAYQKYKHDVSQYAIDHEYASYEDAVERFNLCKECYNHLNTQFTKKEFMELVKSFD